MIILCVLAAGINQAYAGISPVTTELPVIAIKASRFFFNPSKIILKKGQAVMLEITATDRLHGFSIPALGIRTDVMQGQKVVLKITPAKTGKFVFYCDIFCGSGHEEMAGEIAVED